MPHTDGPSTRTNPNEMNLSDAVAAVVGPVCERLGVRSYLRGHHLHAVMLDMVALDANGARESELVAYGLALLDFAKTLKPGAHLDDKTLARLQLDADLADDHLRGVLSIEGENPVMLEQYASALEKSATL